VIPLSSTVLGVPSSSVSPALVINTQAEPFHLYSNQVRISSLTSPIVFHAVGNAALDGVPLLLTIHSVPLYLYTVPVVISVLNSPTLPIIQSNIIFYVNK